MKEALQAADESLEPPTLILDTKTGKMVIPPEEKARLDKIKKDKEDESERERKERVDKLVKNLERKLAIFVESVGEEGGGGAYEVEVGDSFKVSRTKSKERKKKQPRREGDEARKLTSARMLHVW